jgi:hypothetical protein
LVTHFSGFITSIFRMPRRPFMLEWINIDRGDVINRVATLVPSFYTPGLEIGALPEQAHSRWKVRANYFMLRDAIQRNLRHAGQIALFEKLVC